MDKQKKDEKENPQIEILSQGHALIRLENQTQMMTAIQRPRDEKTILNSSLAELDLYRSCAEEAIYSKPVGKDPDTGKMKYAEGLSIRCAESLANRWANSAYGVDIVGEDEEAVILAAVFLDYESNTRHVLQKRVSRYFKTRSGQIMQHPPDRFSDVVIPANQSKLLREVILRSLPAGLKKEYENKSRQILEGGDLQARIKKMITAFKKLGISEKELIELREKDMSEFTHEDITELLGIHNALKDGEITRESLFDKNGKDETKKDSGLKIKIDAGQAESQQNIPATPPAQNGELLQKLTSAIEEIQKIQKAYGDGIQTSIQIIQEFSRYEKDGKTNFAKSLEALIKSEKWANLTLHKMYEYVRKMTPPEEQKEGG